MNTPGTFPRRLYVSMIVSLDGFIEGPNQELDWFHDGDPYFERYCDEMVDSVGMAIYGRKSYELMVRYWPPAETAAPTPHDREFARKMNALPKVVVSRTLERATWQNTRIVRDDVGEAIAHLKREPGKPIVVWAGAAMVGTLARLGLVDEYRLLVMPVLLGGGTPLFREVPKQKLQLVRTLQLGPNVAVLCYEPTRP